MEFGKKARAVCAAVMSLGAAGFAAAQEDSHIWIEGEKPSEANLKPGIGGWGKKQYLSEESWLHYSIAADKVVETVPEGGIVVKYDFEAKAAGEHELWARIGHEFVRSTFEWRVNGGEWRSVAPEELTTNLMELDTWCEVAWIMLGKPALAAGNQSLEIRMPLEKDGNGKPKRVLVEFDAFCFSMKPFAPNGRFKPGEEWRTEKDIAAAAHVFEFPAADAEKAAAGARVAIPLNGVWEIARNDENLPPADIAQPMMDFPADPRWSAIEVPGNKNTLRHDLIFAHRVWYRTRVSVPESMTGRAFALRFPQNNLNTTVFVNGKFCGFFAHPFADFSIDVTEGVKAGENEIWVGIRDAWYGYFNKPGDPMKLRKTFNYPVGFFSSGFQDLVYPVWNHSQSGILKTPELIAAGGKVYASDVFVKPSVSKKTLAAEVTLKNSSGKDAGGKIAWEAVNFKTGEVEKKFAAQDFSLKAGEEKVFELSEGWAEPKLWWPDEPNLYTLRVATSVGDAAAGGRDVSNTRFGFREWDWSAKDFKLNGIVWHGWADCFNASSKEDWLKFYREKNQTVMRLWGTSWQGMSPREALDFYDENGIVCRRSGIFDGEAIGYFVIENDPELKEKSPLKLELFKNWTAQMAAQVRGERNHPSIMIWSIENEILFINCINLYGGLMDQFEEEITKASDEVMRVDPTRPTMVDGGGAAKANTLPVHGDHYVAAKPSQYPPLAYETNPTGGGRNRWVWDEKRPRFIGEDFFMAGDHPEVAAFEGDSAFAGKPVRGVGIWNRILQEGYRWAGYGAWHYWLGQHDTDGSQYKAYSARAAFTREWNWTFGSGESVERTFGIFNDTRHADPIAFAWTLKDAKGKTVGGGSGKETLKVAPGSREVVVKTITMPKVKERAELTLELALAVGGKEVFHDAKAVSVLPVQNRKMGGLEKSAGGSAIVVVDASTNSAAGGSAVSAFLKIRGIAHAFAATFADADIDALLGKARIIIVGANTLDEQESASSRLSALAAAGARVIILDQDKPLRYQGMPAGMETAANTGYTAFGEDFAHPALEGLDSKDFFTWGERTFVYRNAYEKPTRGARSLIQCDDRLRYSALAEVAVGEGLILPCQLNIGENLGSNAAAQQLLLNLIGHAASYRLEHYPVAAFLGGSPQLKTALDSIGLQYKEVDDVMAALAQKAPATALVNATPAALAALAANLPAVRKFAEQGGSLVLFGVTPEGLADYNRIVGFEHMMRKAGRERIILPTVRSRLTAGLTTTDVALFSSQRIFGFRDGNYAADDVFSHVVDYDEIAPFGQSTGDDAFGSYGLIINGFVSADGWPLIINFPKKADDSPYPVPITFPKEHVFTEFKWIGNTFYYPQRKLNLIFDDDRATMLSYEVEPNTEPQTFAIDPPRKATKITLEIAEWDVLPNVSPNIGIDNIYFKVRRPADFHKTVKPFVNLGGLMEYQFGAGRVVLCNLLLQDTESVAENAAKKRRIIATLLRNLKAPFSGGRTVVAGMNLKYQPIDISKHSTQYRGEKGWYGDKAHTFKDLPTGVQRLSGVPFDIYEMATSPVPNALMISGNNIPGDLPKEITGIAVNAKADALFFLHAARIDKHHDDRTRARREGKDIEIAKYLIHYADGETLELPINIEKDVENYIQKTPAILPGAQLAWTKPYESGEGSSAAYMKQWSNPRPEVEIATIDILPGKDNAGVPVVLAITAAQAE